MAKDIRVLIVDDSALMRRLITDMIETTPGFMVSGVARNGQEAVEKTLSLHPEVITMDVEMPVMNGLEALREIMARCPTPVVMLSSLTRHGAEETIRSLELGAVDFVCKPSGAISMDIGEVKQMLMSKLQLAVHARLLPNFELKAPPPRPPVPLKTTALPAARVVAIASSTGGPRALEAIIPKLPADLPAGVVVAQHMPSGFTAVMADRLNSLSALTVREAAEGDLVAQGEVLIAPGGQHLLINGRKRVMSSNAPPVWGVRPAADILMTSAAEAFGAACIGVVLTGMGQDGARGVSLIHQAGGKTIAQDEATCVVYGMPKAAVELGGIDVVVPLPKIAKTIAQLLGSVVQD